ncbi:hypothetical protein SARC_01329 [Sphaeroforma arctica JP610]|uniref:Uncharacterized protein n=1 Tax=Sphaeroforma arctica JP610 TaxID=667725 RepID=A0A0L0GCC8_9EUKA|nr:hypothetical protein SARC_01329 [Sphaeroforma arctica JP610]KNC86556.1 hypothetical protein SARC_01329 [Sphaeroforma arctica JP610]|eukprot:XP_014160458.1 hypothetical protein SARC_01329 [Sphaeroforma arctica JP610]
MARHDDIFQNLPAEEEDSGYTSSDASATMPSLVSNSGSEADETSRPNDQQVRWDQQRESEMQEMTPRPNPRSNLHRRRHQKYKNDMNRTGRAKWPRRGTNQTIS